ncbi:MAG: energy transducer TonB [Rhizomicrobium sp.]|nr:energy transducer TonB [Rhizomicrobium sp.]
MLKTAPVFTAARGAGLFLAALLQTGFIWALVEGLDIKLTALLPPPIDVFIAKPVPRPPPQPVNTRDVLPEPVTAPKPTVDVAEPGRDTALTLTPPRPTPPGPVERGPVGLMATHTTPPYPPMEARLGNEGTVLLRLIVGPDGLVKAASVIRSSGYVGLDRAAQAWVMAHWRYQPAQRGGTAVESAANVAVSFNLRNGGN